YSAICTAAINFIPAHSHRKTELCDQAPPPNRQRYGRKNPLLLRTGDGFYYSVKASWIALLKSSRSFGVRLVIRLSETITDSSWYIAPAFSRSFLTLATLVMS